MRVLIVRPADFKPKDWRDIPQSFRIVSERWGDSDSESFCKGFNTEEMKNPIGLWALTVPECFQPKENTP